MNATMNQGVNMQKIIIGITVFLLVLLAGCDDSNNEPSSEVSQEQHNVTGERTNIADPSIQEDILTIITSAEKEILNDAEAQNIIRLPQNNSARFIEFRINDMWYSLQETGVLTTHQAGQLAEHFQLLDEEVLKSLFIEHAS